MSVLNITAQKREANKKNPFRKSLIEGKIPAVLYNSKENIPISLNRNEFSSLYSKSKSNTIYNITVEKQQKKCFIKAISHSLKKARDIQHVDFFLIDGDKKVNIAVPIVFSGLAKGVTKGGYVEKYTWELRLEVDAGKIPENIEVDISDLDTGDFIYLRDISVPKGAEFTESPDKALVAVMLSKRTVSEKGDTTKEGDEEADATQDKE